MLEVTLRVIDGADRGRVYENLSVPITIGREEGNTIQLNDERISRFHIKIQEDRGSIVLTDLDSTNGTKVNGENVQLRILRHGDLVSLGRSVLLVGSQLQIAERLRRMCGEEAASSYLEMAGMSGSVSDVIPVERELDWLNEAAISELLHAPDPPLLPEGLSPSQAAQLSELLEYLHLVLRNLIESVQFSGKPERISVDAADWQKVLDFQDRLAGYLRRIGDPDGEGG